MFAFWCLRTSFRFDIQQVRHGRILQSPGCNQIRLTAFAAFTVLITIRKKWPEMRKALSHRQAMGLISLGAALGPFIGVSSSLLALQHAPAGIVSSLSSLSPVLIIPFSVLIWKEKVLPKEILGALISIAGVILLFL